MIVPVWKSEAELGSSVAGKYFLLIKPFCFANTRINLTVCNGLFLDEKCECESIKLWGGCIIPESGSGELVAVG